MRTELRSPEARSTAVSENQPGEDAPAVLPPAGACIGQYELIRELGRGGMGTVFLARDTKLGRRVAIKFLQASHPELTARFILEARATARCNHENIVVIHEVDEVRQQGSPFMVLEYLQGSPLSKLLQGSRKLPESRVADLMIPVVRALACAHEHHIVHRDLKPDNIFITETGTVKVLDFGIAKLVQERRSEPAATALSRVGDAADISGAAAAELTRHGTIVGTMPFMSPEQWGVDTVDHRTDIWAVGIIMFCMLAGKHPLAPRTGMQLMETAMIEQPMPGVREACPELSEDLANIVDRCLIKPKQQRMGSARQLLDALEALAPGRHVRRFHGDQAPYAGLSSFQETDAARFFGRTREIAAAVSRLQSQPLVGIIGPSGAGKSSFVRAGVMPALKQSGEPWTGVVVRPGRQPMAALAQAVAQGVSTVSGVGTGSVSQALSEHDALHRRLWAEPGYLGVLLRSRARQRNHNVLVFVDQLEELYTLVPNPAERLAFTRCLASAADDTTSPVRVVVSIRSDFLDRVAEDEHFMAELTRGLFFLTPLSRSGLRDALVLPAELAGYQLESAAMVEHMLDHLEHTPGALPLLQFAAMKLWELRDLERRLLTEASYRAIGGAAGALASHADAVLAEIPAQGQALARALLLCLVTPERTRAVVPLGELNDLSGDARAVQRLVDHLVQARLLVVQTATGGVTTVEIVHESLLHSWPLLRRWLDENQDDAAFLEQLRSAARQWQAKGYAQGLLWRGEAMEEARRWSRRYSGELPALQQAYLQAVFALAARASRRVRYAMLGVIGFLLLVVAGGAVALVVIRDAQTEATAQAGEARRQLERARIAEREATAERENAVAATEQVETANTQLVHKNRELVTAIDAAEQARSEAERARGRAESAKGKARRDRRRARRREQEARLAETRAQDANQRLEALLERERERIRKLEKQGATNAVPDVPID